MTLTELARERGHEVRRFEYDDGAVVAVDLGPATEATIDTVGDTVIVVADGDQYEFEVPGDEADAHTFIKNGVLTIEMEAEL